MSSRQDYIWRQTRPAEKNRSRRIAVVAAAQHIPVLTESLAEESHNEEGYLEYPNFTKPQNWRDIAVPEILLSGNHGEIAKWRAAQAIERAKDNF